MTHKRYPGAFDHIEAFLKVLRILFGILATYQDLDWDFAPLERLKVFCWL